MAYCTVEDCKDTLLRITEADIAEATAYIVSLAQSLGVQTVTSPTPYEVKQLAIAYACSRRALYLTGKSPKAAIDGDAYQGKYKFYSTEVARWESKLTPELLAGRRQARRTYPISIPMYRG